MAIFAAPIAAATGWSCALALKAQLVAYLNRRRFAQQQHADDASTIAPIMYQAGTKGRTGRRDQPGHDILGRAAEHRHHAEA